MNQSHPFSIEFPERLKLIINFHIFFNLQNNSLGSFSQKHFFFWWIRAAVRIIEVSSAKEVEVLDRNDVENRDFAFLEVA